MTVIEMQQDKNSVDITIDGHAGYAKNGQDIVCAGVSTLAYTLINCLEEQKSIGNVSSLDYVMPDGYISISFTYMENVVENIVKTIMTGFLMLEQNYPENVSLVGGK